MTKNEAIANVNRKLPDRISAADPRIDAGRLREALAIIFEYADYLSDFSLPNFDAFPSGQVSAPGEGKLAIRGNKVSGQSDVAFITPNVASIGMTFWRKPLNASEKLLLALIDGNAGLGTLDPIERLDVVGRVALQGITATGGTPTALKLGDGLGATGAAAIVAGSTDWLGQIIFETGTDPQGGVNQTFARIIFSTPMPRPPRGCILSAANPAATSAINKVHLSVDNASLSSVVLLANKEGTALPPSTQFVFTYMITA